MIHHYFPGWNEHHVPHLVAVFLQHARALGVPPDRHRFTICGTPPDQRHHYDRLLAGGARLAFSGSYSLGSGAFAAVPDGDAVIVHSAFFPDLWKRLAAHPRLWRRTALAFWGGDVVLLAARRATHDRPGAARRPPFGRWNRLRDLHVEHGLTGLPGQLSLRARHRTRRFLDRWRLRLVLPRVGAVCTLTPGEFRILNDACGPCQNHLPYVFATYRPDLSLRTRSREGAAVRVLLGNSANVTNRHLEVLPWLARFARAPVQVVCPLAYPDHPTYREQVVAAGRDLLGDRFVPLLEMLPHADYGELLRSIDIVVHHAARQQALFCLYSSLLVGAKVYLSSESPTFEMLRGLGIVVGDTASLATLDCAEFLHHAESVRRANWEIADREFSLEASLAHWRRIFARVGGT